MVNRRGGFQATVPGSSYGSKATFNVSSAVKTIAENLNAWASTNLIDYILSSTKYVECSITYAHNIPGQSTGWKFWTAYVVDGVKQGELYVSLPSTIVGHNFTLEIFNQTGTWKAKYTDLNTSTTGTHTIPGSPPSTTIYTGRKPDLFVESADAQCISWSSLTGSNAVTFSNVKYYDQFLNIMSFTPSFNGLSTAPMPTCVSGGPCLNQDVTNVKLSYQGC